MRTQFLSDPEDLDWLRTTALKNLNVPPFKSFVITGNEDAPDNVCVYGDVQPTVFDAPLAVYKPDKKGNLAASQ